jgi:hypothetical protein
MMYLIILIVEVELEFELKGSERWLNNDYLDIKNNFKIKTMMLLL